MRYSTRCSELENPFIHLQSVPTNSCSARNESSPFSLDSAMADHLRIFEPKREQGIIKEFASHRNEGGKNVPDFSNRSTGRTASAKNIQK